MRSNNLDRGIEDENRLKIGEKIDAGKLEKFEIASKLESKLFFENLEWLTTAEAATYLRKFYPTGLPSVNAVHKLVSQGKIRRRKFAGRLFFKRKELDYLIECSEA